MKTMSFLSISIALAIVRNTGAQPTIPNILTPGGKPVEDVDGNILTPEPTTATSPQVCLVDPQPRLVPPSGDEVTSANGTVILSDDPATGKPAAMPTYCGSMGSQLYYRNTPKPPPNNAPSGGAICINKRDNAIPDYVINGNKEAHRAIAAYLKQKGISAAPWLFYKLINVQYFPYDKVITKESPNGSLYDGKPPFTAAHPAPSSYYQANIVVETSRSLQLFSGGLSPVICSDWNQDGTPHKNTFYGGHAYNTGGCMGCHGSQGQNPAFQAGDFSVILARGSVRKPEIPSIETTAGMTRILRNRSLTR